MSIGYARLSSGACTANFASSLQDNNGPCSLYILVSCSRLLTQEGFANSYIFVCSRLLKRQRCHKWNQISESIGFDNIHCGLIKATSLANSVFKIVLFFNSSTKKGSRWSRLSYDSSYEATITSEWINQTRLLRYIIKQIIVMLQDIMSKKRSGLLWKVLNQA